jgi:hypothetical protein
MTDWSAVLAEAFKTTDRRCGDCGDSGDTRNKALKPVKHLPDALGTTSGRSVVTVVTPHPVVTTVTTAASGDGDKGEGKISLITQRVRESVTTVTTGTPNIHSLGAQDRLRSMIPPDCFSAEAWHQMLLDVDCFFQHWSERPELIAWSDSDLVGVHPSGLLFVVRGGKVISLNDQCATILTQRGSRLSYQKSRCDAAVAVWEIGQA